MPRFLVLLILPVVFSGCILNEGASPEVKEASLQRHREEWQGPKPLRAALLSRSVQVLSAEKVSIREGNKLSVGGTVGLACFVTADGYALTASHVVNSPPHCVLTGGLKGGAQQLVFLEDRKAAKDVDEESESGLSGKKMPGLRYQVWNAAGARAPSVKIVIKKVPVRIVSEWPESDLALIKIPVKNSSYFRVAKSPPKVGEVLFTPGNPIAAAPQASAGQVLESSRREESFRLFTSIPLTPGDSGGPAANSGGTLVGVASRGLPEKEGALRSLINSSFILPDRAEMERLIAEDRLKD